MCSSDLTPIRHGSPTASGAFCRAASICGSCTATASRAPAASSGRPKPPNDPEGSSAVAWWGTPGRRSCSLAPHVLQPSHAHGAARNRAAAACPTTSPPRALEVRRGDHAGPGLGVRSSSPMCKTIRLCRAADMTACILWRSPAGDGRAAARCGDFEPRHVGGKGTGREARASMSRIALRHARGRGDAQELDRIDIRARLG